MNMPNVNKGNLNIRIDLEFIARIRKVASSLGITPTEAARNTLLMSFARIPLSKDDKEWVETERRKNEGKRKLRLESGNRK